MFYLELGFEKNKVSSYYLVQLHNLTDFILTVNVEMNNILFL